MQARCKSDFKIGNQYGAIYQKDNWYDYYIEIHEETGREIYYVDGQPMLVRTFKENFDDIQAIREEKLNQLLNENKM